MKAYKEYDGDKPIKDKIQDVLRQIEQTGIDEGAPQEQIDFIVSDFKIKCEAMPDEFWDSHISPVFSKMQVSLVYSNWVLYHQVGEPEPIPGLD